MMRSLPKNLFIILVLRYPKLNNASKIPVRNLTPYIVGTDSRNNVLVGTEKFCRVLLLRGLGLPLRDQKREQKGSGMDGRTDRFPLYSTGLCPLRFPLRPLPCLLNSQYQEMPKQGKGTDDHLLPLGDWLLCSLQIFILNNQYASDA